MAIVTAQLVQAFHTGKLLWASLAEMMRCFKFLLPVLCVCPAIGWNQRHWPQNHAKWNGCFQTVTVQLDNLGDYFSNLSDSMISVSFHVLLCSFPSSVCSVFHSTCTFRGDPSELAFDVQVYWPSGVHLHYAHIYLKSVCTTSIHTYISLYICIYILYIIYPS